MIDSYVEQCKRAGRELAVKEASAYGDFIWPLLGYEGRSLFGSALGDTLGLLGGSAALGAGVKAMSRNKALRNINRTAGTAGGALGGAGLGMGIPLSREAAYPTPLEYLSKTNTLGHYRTYGGETAVSRDQSPFSLIAEGIDDLITEGYGSTVSKALPLAIPSTLLGAYAGNKLVRGSEKLQPILAKKLRS